MKQLSQWDESTDKQHRDVLDFLHELSQRNLTSPQIQKVSQLLRLADCVENMGDVLETQWAQEGKDRIQLELHISEETKKKLLSLHRSATDAIDLMIASWQHQSRELAIRLIESKEHFNNDLRGIQTHLASRLASEQPKRAETYRFETNMIDSFKRLHTLARRGSKILLQT